MIINKNDDDGDENKNYNKSKTCQTWVYCMFPHILPLIWFVASTLCSILLHLSLALGRVCHSSSPASTASDIRLCVKSRLHTKILFISLDLKPSPCTLRPGKTWLLQALCCSVYDFLKCFYGWTFCFVFCVQERLLTMLVSHFFL